MSSGSGVEAVSNLQRAGIPLNKYREDCQARILATVGNLVTRQEIEPKIGESIIALARLDPLESSWRGIDLDHQTARALVSSAQGLGLYVDKDETEYVFGQSDGIRFFTGRDEDEAFRQTHVALTLSARDLGPDRNPERWKLMWTTVSAQAD